MTTNRQHVDYSARYGGYVITDNRGQVQFSSNGLPLVFRTKLDALSVIR